jgi:predicted DNA-binding protein
MTKKLVSVFIEKEQEARLNKLSAKTRVPKAAYIREGIDLALEKHEKKLKDKKKIR